MGIRDLEGRKYVSLTTFRRNGEEVATPVWFILEDRVFIWTMSNSGKVKRLRHNPKVALAPCTVRGGIVGPRLTGVASILHDDSSPALNEAFKSKFGLMFTIDRLVTKITGKRRVFLDISLDEP